MESLAPDRAESRRKLLHFDAEYFTGVQIEALAMCAAWIEKAETTQQQKDLAIFLGYYTQFTPENQKTAIESMRQLSRQDDMDRYRQRFGGVDLQAAVPGNP